MRPLILDDLLPLDEYANRRREFFDSLTRYLDRYRRVRVGPDVTVLFENRQTLWFRLQEILRVARLAEPGRVQEELDLYNRLLPRRDQLQAALLIETDNGPGLTEKLAFWKNLRGESLRLRIGKCQFPGRLVTCRPEDHCIGAAHWVQFQLEAEGRRLLQDFRRSASLEMEQDSYHHHSSPLTEDVRQSLLDDLQLSASDVVL